MILPSGRYSFPYIKLQSGHIWISAGMLVPSSLGNAQPLYCAHHDCTACWCDFAVFGDRWWGFGSLRFLHHTVWSDVECGRGTQLFRVKQTKAYCFSFFPGGKGKSACKVSKGKLIFKNGRKGSRERRTFFSFFSCQILPKNFIFYSLFFSRRVPK